MKFIDLECFDVLCDSYFHSFTVSDISFVSSTYFEKMISPAHRLHQTVPLCVVIIGPKLFGYFLLLRCDKFVVYESIHA